MKCASKLLGVAFAIASVPATAAVTIFGMNYDWYNVTPQCPQELLTPVIPNYSIASNRAIVANQLKIMHVNGANIIEPMVGLDASYGAGAIYPNIANETDSLKIQHLNSYFTTVNQFVTDVVAAGIPNLQLKIGGWYGACTTGGAVDTVSLQKGIADGEKVIDAMVLNVINGTNATMINMRIDLGNEIGPSNYEQQCTKDGKTQYIGAIWTYFVDHYPALVQKASFSSILDSDPNFEVAGNRLKNLILAISATGRQMPSWFDVHAYRVNSTGSVTAGATLAKLRGLYQVYSDFGFLSTQANPKETVIGEIHYQDVTTANEIQSFLTSYDGGKVNLTSIIEWPLQPPVGSCSIVANVNAPYKTTIYNNKLVSGLSQTQITSTITASPNPVTVPVGQVANTTVSWNAPAYTQVAIWVSGDGGAPGPITPSSGVGSMVVPWIQKGHTYTFLLYPFANGATQSPLLDSVTVIGQ